MNVYLGRKNGAVVYHTDLKAMKEIDGIDAPEKTVSEQEWEAAGGLARVIGNEIFIGKTEAEKAAEKAEAERIATVADLKKKLADTDYIAVKIAEGAATAQEYAAKLAERKAWRLEIQGLQSA